MLDFSPPPRYLIHSLYQQDQLAALPLETDQMSAIETDRTSEPLTVHHLAAHLIEGPLKMGMGVAEVVVVTIGTYTHVFIDTYV
jgi:hypothetical protein